MHSSELSRSCSKIVPTCGWVGCSGRWTETNHRRVENFTQVSNQVVKKYLKQRSSVLGKRPDSMRIKNQLKLFLSLNIKGFEVSIYAKKRFKLHFPNFCAVTNFQHLDSNSCSYFIDRQASISSNLLKTILEYQKEIVWKKSRIQIKNWLLRQFCCWAFPLSAR